MTKGGEKDFPVAAGLLYCPSCLLNSIALESAVRKEAVILLLNKEPHSYLTTDFETLLEHFPPFLQDLKVHAVLCDRI